MSKEELKEEIKKVRKALYSIACKSKFYTDYEVVKKSQELDKLIYMYQTL